MLFELKPFSLTVPDDILLAFSRKPWRIVRNLFSNCLQSGVFSMSWKKAIVGRIRNIWDRNDQAYCSPTIQIGVPSKVLERSLKRAILLFPRDSDLLPPHQNGWATNMLPLMDSLTQAFDDRMVSHAIFIDFENAFDRVPHIPLPYGLELYGILERY